MNERMMYAAAAVLLTALSAIGLVAAEPTEPDRPKAQGGAAVAGPVVKVAPAVIERGRYLVKIAGCNDCHTPGYAPSAGKVDESQWLIGNALGWQGPWGTTYPTNLRLFMKDVAPAQWLQIARSPTRPPMPWFALRDMTDQDLLAIYHYVRALGPAGNQAPAYLPPGAPPKTPTVKFPSPPGA